MWKFVALAIFGAFLAIFYAVLFEDDTGQELVVFAIIAMSVVAGGLISSVQKYMSSWMGLNSTAIWVQLGIVMIICVVAIIGEAPTVRDIRMFEVKVEIAIA